MKDVYYAKILANEQIRSNIFSLQLQTGAAKYAKAGQFLSVLLGDGALLLPRPLSLCEIFRDGFRIVYRIEGAGTKWLSQQKIGELRILAPLGSCFKIDESDKHFAIVGGGIGVPPLLELTKSIRNKISNALIDVYLGFRDGESVILEEDFKRIADSVNITTDDGSLGIKGNISAAFQEFSGDAIYACGPHIMLKMLASKYQNRKLMVSLEERMACTIGACLACVVDTTAGRRRVCSAGPVFDAKDIEWGE